MPPRPTELCGNCAENDTNLRRCAGCGGVRYCSKTCQREDWKEHKPTCVMSRQMVKKAETFGPECTARFKAMGKWAEKFVDALARASISALDLSSHPEHFTDFVFVVHLDYLGAAIRVPHNHRIAAAEAVRIDDVAKRFAEDKCEDLVRASKLRILLKLKDRRFSGTYVLSLNPPGDIRLPPRDPCWFDRLQSDVMPVGPQDRARVAPTTLTLEDVSDDREETRFSE